MREPTSGLARYLQSRFRELAPAGWTCTPEKRLFGQDQERLLGYSPRVDVLLERADPPRRIWVEFEISRADPVANHVKYAAGSLFVPRGSEDAYVAMLSPHIVRGRRNLSSSAVLLMRVLGLTAFQTVLLPQLTGEEVKRLNHSSARAIGERCLPVERELDRALAVAEVLSTHRGHRIHFASDPFEVMLNVRAWNEQIATPAGRALWKRRRVEYFVHDIASGQFAPSKFCAFVPLPAGGPASPPRADGLGSVTMSMSLYASLDESETRFDGRIAWKHLCDRLGFEAVPLRSAPSLVSAFGAWAALSRETVHVAAPETVILRPPHWFVG